MATIGTLAVKLVASAQGFASSMDRAAAAVKHFAKDALKLGTAVAKIKAGLAALEATAIGAMAIFGAKSATELAKLSRELGATTAGIAELQHAAKALGGDGSEVAAGLAALNSTLSAAARGSFAAGDTFERLGLSVRDLASLPVDKAFGVIAARLAAVSDPGQRAALATQIFGDAAGKLLPLLSLGADGSARFAEEAKRLGLTLTDAQASATEDAFAFTKLKAAFEGVSRQIAANLAPWINAAGEQLGKLGVTSQDVSARVVAGFRWAAKAVAFLVDAWTAVTAAGKMFQLGIQTIVWAFTRAVQKILEVGGKLPDALGGNTFREAAKSVDNFAEGAWKAMEETKAEFDKILDTPSAIAQVDDFFDAVTKRQNELARQRGSAKTGGGATNAFARDAEAYRKAAGVIDGVKSPLEGFRETMRGINAMLKDGAIGWDTYARNAGKAVAELEKAHNLQDIRLAGAARAGSAEAYSAVVRSSREADVRLRESPQDRIARVLRETKDIEANQLQQLRKIAEAMAAQPAVKEVMIQ